MEKVKIDGLLRYESCTGLILVTFPFCAGMETERLKYSIFCTGMDTERLKYSLSAQGWILKGQNVTFSAQGWILIMKG